MLDWPRIRVAEKIGDPPEQYRFEFNIQGLEVSSDGQIQERSHHVVEVNLSLGYPRRMPQCKMLTPIFHPNFDQTTVCIGDFWSASEGLDDLILRIGRMIAFQEYNTKSPLNGHAARWAEEHPDLLPVDARELSPPHAAEAESELDLHISIGPEVDEVATPIPRHDDTSPPIPASARPSGVSRPADDIVSLAPELSLLGLRARCDRCKTTIELDLTDLKGPVVCTHCGTQHEVGRAYECTVIESAGLFWIRQPSRP